MGFFKKKEDRFVDLTARAEKQEQRLKEMKEDFRKESKKTSTIKDNLDSSDNQGVVGLPFFGFGGQGGSSSDNQNVSEKSIDSQSSDHNQSFGEVEKRKKLAKRLSDMTSKIEDLSNIIYKLEQRIKTLEEKSGDNNKNPGERSGENIHGSYGVF